MLGSPEDSLFPSVLVILVFVIIISVCIYCINSESSCPCVDSNDTSSFSTTYTSESENSDHDEVLRSLDRIRNTPKPKLSSQIKLNNFQGITSVTSVPLGPNV